MFTLRGITEKELKREIKDKGDVFRYKDNMKILYWWCEIQNEKC